MPAATATTPVSPLTGTVPVLGASGSTRGGTCEQLHDFVTGGGWFNPANSAPGNYQPGRVNFGFNAGPRPGNPEIKGHLNALNHQTGQHLEGVNVDSYAVWSNTDSGDATHCRTFTGDALLDGASGRYQAWVCDYGEPGRNDRFAVVLARHEFTRDGKRREYRTAHVYEVRDGKLSACWEQPRSRSHGR